MGLPYLVIVTLYKWWSMYQSHLTIENHDVRGWHIILSNNRTSW